MRALEKKVLTFREERGLEALIAISGTADHDPRVIDVVNDLLEELQYSSVGIISSGTNAGVPVATVAATQRLSLPLVRVYPTRAAERGHLAEIEADLEIPIVSRYGSSEWGDESEVFIKLADGIVFIGGNEGTLLEMAFWAKRNKSRHGRNLPLIPVVAVSGLGGWSQWLAEEGRQKFSAHLRNAMPQIPISSGTNAAIWMLERLGLFDRKD